MDSPGRDQDLLGRLVSTEVPQIPNLNARKPDFLQGRLKSPDLPLEYSSKHESLRGRSSPDLTLEYQNNSGRYIGSAYSQHLPSAVLSCRRALDFDGSVTRRPSGDVQINANAPNWQEEYFPPYFTDFHHFPQTS